MPCYVMNGVSICRPTVTDRKLKRLSCPTCKKKRMMWMWFQEWYGWHVTCLGCGEQWQDGEMLERPFMPAWRKKNIERAKKNMTEFKAALAGKGDVKPVEDIQGGGK